jgi:23S rRNA-/tRNA-specific pseudouridylate synthase
MVMEKNNRKSKNFFKVIDKNSEASLVEMKPITGRKHQLRKQLYAILDNQFMVIKI